MSKSIRIEAVPSSTLVKFAWNGGGELPAELSGTYTNTAAAMQAFRAWIANQKDREVNLEQKEEAPKRGPGRPRMNPLG